MIINNCGSSKKYLLPVLSSCMILAGGVQMIGALTLTNPNFMLLLLSSGLWNFISGLAVGLMGKAGYIKGPTQASLRRRTICVRWLLGLTASILITAVLLVHLQHSHTLKPWPNVVASRKILQYQTLSETLSKKGIWLVTGTSIIGAVASLCALMFTFVVDRSSSFSLHDNLATVESLGWVYEPSPRPDIIPPTMFPQARCGASHHKSKKSATKCTSVTLVSFKHDLSLNRHVSLPVRRLKDRLVLVDSTPLGPTLPVNLDFGKNSPSLRKHTLDQDCFTRTNSEQRSNPLNMVHKF